jgi:hypothetical protein
MVSPRLNVDILPIPRLLFVHCPLEKELKSSMKVLTGVAIMFACNWPHRVNRLWKMLVERLLPGSPVLSLEHIFKLRNGVDPGEVVLFCPFVKFGDPLLIVNSIEYYLPLSLWISTQILFWGLLLCNL